MIKVCYLLLVHITDWFPTILSWAKYSGKMPKNLDGLNQVAILEDKQASRIRTAFIAGVMNTWDEENHKWNRNQSSFLLSGATLFLFFFNFE